MNDKNAIEQAQDLPWQPPRTRKEFKQAVLAVLNEEMAGIKSQINTVIVEGDIKTQEQITDLMRRYFEQAA